MEDETQTQSDAGQSFFGGDAGASSTDNVDQLINSAASESTSTTPEVPNDVKQTANGGSPVADDAEKKAEAETKASEEALETAKKVGSGLKDATKLKPGYGGLTGLVDAYGSGKAAIEAATQGDYGGAVTNALDAGGAAAKAIGPALQKGLPSVLPGLARALGPVGVGASLGAPIVNAADNVSASSDFFQRQYKLDGSANADGSPTSITDSVRNTGNQVEASIAERGWPTVGKVAGVGTKVVGAAANLPNYIGAAGYGAGKGAINLGKKLLGLGDG